jgi:ABC-type transporter MlaC component
MKHSFLIGILLVVLFLLVTCLPAQAETTQVCITVKDKAGEVVKDSKGKVKQNCKTMKKHQKLEGTRVPEKK